MKDIVAVVLLILPIIGLAIVIPQIVFYPITSQLKTMEIRLKEIADAIKAKGE